MKTLKERTEIQQAFLDGTEVVSRYLGCKEDTVWDDCMGCNNFDWGNYDFKIKPKPMVRYINIYSGNLGECLYKSYGDAKNSLDTNGRTIKFIQVMDD